MRQDYRDIPAQAKAESHPPERPVAGSLGLRTGLRVGAYVPLGDAVAWLTHATGLDKLAQKYTEVTGQDCGCDERRAWLNQLIKY
jgi:hypothetical protein